MLNLYSFSSRLTLSILIISFVSSCSKSESDTDVPVKASVSTKSKPKAVTKTKRRTARQPTDRNLKFSNLNYKETMNYVRTINSSLLYEERKYKLALSALREIEQSTRDNNQYVSLLEGNILYTVGKFKDSIKPFSNYIRLVPKDFNGYWNRAKAYYHTQLYNEAIEDYKKALPLMSQQLELNKKSIGIVDNRLLISSLYKRLGACYEKKDDFKSAVYHYQQALALQINKPFKPIADKRIVSKSKAKALKVTLNKLNKSIADAPKNWNLYLKRALIYEELGSLDKALQDLRLVYKNYKKPLLLVHTEGAKIYYLKREYRKAAKIYRSLYRIDPLKEDELAYTSVGKAKSTELQEYKSLFERINKLISMSPDLADNYYNRAIYHIGFGGYLSAAHDFRKYIELTDSDPLNRSRLEALALCSLCYKISGEDKLSSEFLKVALEIAPKKIWFSNVIFYLSGKLSEKQLLQSCKDQDLETMSALYFIGQNKYANRDFDAAKETFLQVVKRFDSATDEHFLSLSGLIRMDYEQRTKATH